MGPPEHKSEDPELTILASSLSFSGFPSQRRRGAVYLGLLPIRQRSSMDEFHGSRTPDLSNSNPLSRRKRPFILER
jgi:hypothetical protein